MINFLFVFQDPALLLVRFVLGLILLVHGWPKINNLGKESKKLEDMGFKPGGLWAFLVASIEVVGGLAIMVGLFTQLFATLVAIQFLVILLTVKREASFMGGLEFDLLLFVVSILLATSGGGMYSLDSMLNVVLY